MTGLVWVSIFVGLALAALAVGIPYLLTHKGMRSPHDLSEGQAYMQAKRRWRQRRNAAAAQPGLAARQQGTAQPLPTERPEN